MTGIDPDIEDILDKEVDDFHTKQMLRDILDWEDQQLYKTRRRGKKDTLEEFIDNYLEDKK
jgi:hypothetical protein